jgi:hypothetical protein
MNTSANTFSVTAQAATTSGPIQPAITFIAEKAVISKKLLAAAP